MNKPEQQGSLTKYYGVVLALVAVPTFLVGLYLAATGKGWAMLGAGCASLVALGIAWPLLTAIEGSRKSNLDCMRDMINPFNERMQQMNVMLNQISEQQLISDRTKQVAYRTRDRETLRRAIHEEIANQDWEAALVLANDMGTVFGYKQEAARIRKDIEAKHQETIRKQVGESVASIDKLVRAELWQDALAEAHKVAQSFPNDEQAHNLPQAIEQRRAAHKKQLQESFRDAIQRHDVDGGIEILRKLDPYLTPQEAEAMQETARNLFKEKLNALRTQLALAIKGEQWQDAYRLSETIMTDFPNTRIAQEVRERMDELKQRVVESSRPAGETAGATA